MSKAASKSISKHIVEKTYPVQTGDTFDFYKTMFENDTGDGPLCKSVNIPGCENAVAATSWHLSFVGGSTLYNSTGHRQTLHPHCDISILMPKWVDAHKADAVQQHAVSHFLGHTATHEKGHGQACSSLATSIMLLVSNMPSRVPVARVAEFNHAFDGLIELFTRGARAADNEFDNFTGHGGEQDAQLGTHEDQIAAASTAGGAPSGAASDFQTAVRQATAAVVLTPSKTTSRVHSGGVPADEEARAVSHTDDSASRLPLKRTHAVQIATGLGGAPRQTSHAYSKDTQWLFALAGVIGSILHEDQ
jgi:hypothetical protein